MMAAMMLPSSAPFFVAAARGADGWRTGAVVAGLGIYLAVWWAFGAALVILAAAVPVAAALAIAVAYACLPLMWRGRARCIAMCKASNRDGAAAGLRYAVGCVECSAGLMLAVMAVGMADPRWMAGGAVGAFVLKVPLRQPRYADGAPGGR